MKEVNKKDLRNFGLILALIFLVIGVRLFFKLHQARVMYFIISALFVLFSLFFPVGLRSLYNVFIKVAHAIGWINTRIILITVFCLIVTPIGLVGRLLRKDFLGLKIEKEKTSYWIKRTVRAPDQKQYEKQF